MRLDGLMTRTQWLLVALIGLVAWLGGFTLQLPLLAILGIAALLVGIVGAIFGKRATT